MDTIRLIGKDDRFSRFRIGIGARLPGERRLDRARLCPGGVFSGLPATGKELRERSLLARRYDIFYQPLQPCIAFPPPLFTGLLGEYEGQGFCAAGTAGNGTGEGDHRLTGGNLSRCY
jgi:hypothetical protein